jgi:hypothetical protein
MRTSAGRFTPQANRMGSTKPAIAIASRKTILLPSTTGAAPKASAGDTVNLNVPARPVLSNGDALFDGSHVGMRGMNAAVDDRDADPATRVLSQEHVETGDRGPDVSSPGSR